MPSTGQPRAADVVVVGGGTVGAWCAYFLRRDGLRVILIEKGMLGQGASSRAAGVVRAQGGTPEAVRLAHWTQRFYQRQRDEIGIDSGFVAQGYLLPCFTEAEVPVAQQRMAMQNSLGLDVELAEPGRGGRAQPDAGPGPDAGRHVLRGRRLPHPARNVTAYAVALAASGVDVRERVRFRGLLARPAGSAACRPARARSRRARWC